MSLSHIESLASSALLTLATSTGGGDAAPLPAQHHSTTSASSSSSSHLHCRFPGCGLKFPTMMDLRDHTMAHRDGRPFACGVCDKTFRKGSDLKRHLRIHTGERPYVCDVCARAFAEAGSLHRHERCHTGEKPFACSACSQMFCRAYNARKHIMKHDPSEEAAVITVIMLEKAAPIRIGDRAASALDREMDLLSKVGAASRLADSPSLLSTDDDTTIHP